MPKADSGFCHIYDLFLPVDFLVNNFINPAWAALYYTQIETILTYIIIASRGYYLVKQDIKDAF